MKICGKHGKKNVNIGKCIRKDGEKSCKCERGWDGKYCT